jgi:hypothetical protein
VLASNGQEQKHCRYQPNRFNDHMTSSRISGRYNRGFHVAAMLGTNLLRIAIYGGHCSTLTRPRGEAGKCERRGNEPPRNETPGFRHACD